MRIQMIESYYAGSHRKWAEGFAAFSRHSVDILSLPGRYWKWRMHGGAVTLAGTWLERNLQPDLSASTRWILSLSISHGAAFGIKFLSLNDQACSLALTSRLRLIPCSWASITKLR